MLEKNESTFLARISPDGFGHKLCQLRYTLHIYSKYLLTQYIKRYLKLPKVVFLEFQNLM
jgi:hypothetical protein